MGSDGGAAVTAGGGLPAVLAIDGGNSKTDLALVAADGELLATARGPGLESGVPLEAVVGVLADLVSQVQRLAGRDGLPVAAHTSACVANADLPEEEELLAAALRERGWSASTEVTNDTFAVLRAGLGGSGLNGAERPRRTTFWGVAVTCGAGLNCVGIDLAGRTARFLALGELTGDWGGGIGLGRAMLWCAIRAEDGRGSQTSLRESVPAHFGLASVQDVAVAIHQETISEYALAGLVPALFAAAAAGDQVARSLVSRQAKEICSMAIVVMRRLDLTERATPVVLGGGVLAAGDPLLIGGISAGIAAQAPDAVVRVTAAPPVAGAALLGLDRTGAGRDAELRLRAPFGSGGRG
jgi:N-acetylglucosamine kinase-like BadF-type ATPase